MQALYGVVGVGSALAAVRAQGRRVAFVPTMGNLHQGHLALVERAVEVGEHCVVSIFVNPYQFGEGEDYLTYPRTVDEDIAKLEALGADLAFVPQVDDIYPQGLDHVTRIEVPELGATLCGQYRPIFFRGVTTVVGILFNIVQPHVAVFGEKDYQQLVIIRRMVEDLHISVEIAAVPTVREPDGLAMSSRNRYLSKEERSRAPRLYSTLVTARDAVRGGARDYSALENAGMSALKAEGFRPDYFSIRRAADLAPPRGHDANLRIFTAAWLGTTRLIDNVAVSD